MDNEIIVRLKILSSLRSPEEITKLIGISPDKSWHIGDARPKTTISEKQHGCLFNSRLPKTASLEAHIEALLSLLLPHAESIRSLSSEDTVEFSCVIYASTAPALYFDKEIIMKIGRLGASLDVDLFLM